MRLRARVLASFLGIAAFAGGGSAARAAVLYTAGSSPNSFASPTFTTTGSTPAGNLSGQGNFVSSTYGSGTSAVIQTTQVDAPDTQGVLLSNNGSGGGGGWAPETTSGQGLDYAPNTAADGSNRYVQIDFDMNVNQSGVTPTNPASSYGSFFGLDVDGAPGQRIANFGVEATNGYVLIGDSSGLDTIPGSAQNPANPSQVGFGAWHHYTLTLDYRYDTYSVALDGTTLESGIPFNNYGPNETASEFSYGSLATFTLSSSNGGSAAIDNYVVQAVPEPSSLALFGVLGMFVSMRARRSRKPSALGV